MNRPECLTPIIFLTLWLGACASPALEAPATEATALPAPLGPAAKGGEPDADRVEAWTYAILVAEFAGHRGDLATASSHYLEAARLTRDAEVTQRAVRIALAADEADDAVRAARLLTELRPDDADGYRILALAELRAGSVDRAVAALDRIISLDPEKLNESFIVAAALLSREEGHDQAWQVMQALVKRHDGDAEAHLSLARLGARWQHFEPALEAIGAALALRPHWDEALLLRAQIQVLDGSAEDALEQLRVAIGESPDSARLRRFYGQMLLEQKQYQAAIEQFRALVELEPENGEARMTLGALYLQQEQPEAARAVFDSLLSMDEFASDAHFYLGQVAEINEKFAVAVEHYAAVGPGSNYLDAQIRRGVVLAEQGKLDRALAGLDGLDSELPSERLRVALVRGELLRDAKRDREAYGVYTEALNILPGNPDLLYARAMVSERMGRVDWLEQDLHTILKVDPEHIQALNALGYTLADRTQRYDEALGYIERAFALNPDDYYILDSMGWVQYRLGNHDRALEYLRQALDKKPDIDIAAHLGEVLWVTGDQQGAREAWQLGLAIEGDTSLINEVMQRLKVDEQVDAGTAQDSIETPDAIAGEADDE